MATFTEVLPATKSSKHTAMNWTPEPDAAGRGKLTVHTDRASVTYAVTEFGTPWDGRAFHFEKVTAGTDKESAAEDVFVCRNGQDHHCSCKGFAYGRGKPCKHVSAALALLANDWV